MSVNAFYARFSLKEMIEISVVKILFGSRNDFLQKLSQNDKSVSIQWRVPDRFCERKSSVAEKVRFLYDFEPISNRSDFSVMHFWAL